MGKIYTEIRSGLGNQLFQFSCGYALAREYNKELVLCPSYFDNSWKYSVKKILGLEARSFRLPRILKNKFSISTENITKQKLLDRSIIILKENEVDVQEIRSTLSGEKDVYLKGYWQRPELFSLYKEQLSQLVEPSFPLSKICKKTLNRMN